MPGRGEGWGGQRLREKLLRIPLIGFLGVPWLSMGHAPENMASGWASGSCYKRKWALWVWRPCGSSKTHWIPEVS